LQIKYAGFVKNGKLKLFDESSFRNAYKKFEGKKIYLTLDEDKPPRSREQNSYYWAVVIKILADELGYFPDEIHEALKNKFLTPKHILNTNTYTTKYLTTQQFEEYLEKIRIFSITELKIDIPKPNQIEV